MSFKVILKESDVYELDMKISSLVNLFKEIHIDYNQIDPIKLNNIDRRSFEVILSFCKIIDYKDLNLPRPLYLYSDKIKEVIKSNSELDSFYKNINLNNISGLIDTIDFLGIDCLETIIYYKIYDELVFSKTKNNQNLSNIINSDSKEYEEIYDKYIRYCQRFVDSLSSEEINTYLENYVK